jgi:hypothetical protein
MGHEPARFFCAQPWRSQVARRLCYQAVAAVVVVGSIFLAKDTQKMFRLTHELYQYCSYLA